MKQFHQYYNQNIRNDKLTRSRLKILFANEIWLRNYKRAFLDPRRARIEIYDILHAFHSVTRSFVQTQAYKHNLSCMKIATQWTVNCCQSSCLNRQIGRHVLKLQKVASH